MRKRNVTITVRCTEDERDKIKARAAQHGLKLSDYVLRSALGKKIVVVSGLDEVVRQLKALGNNVNQIARAVNEGRVQAVQLGDVQRTLYAIYGLLGQIIKEVR
ncbi:MAG: plasmid mobilization relaxosome protein MobC [Ruminococcus sp.]|nr:plasmid mobilization relaxosome protein MobC [Ruminococcus sp.]